jgi:hypothetical protein
MAINEEILESFLNNNISILDEIIGTDAAELTSLLNSATISGMKASDILNDIAAASSRSTQATLLNTRLNTMSRVATNTMMKDAPADTKYVYVGPIDEKTRDICLQMASKGPITEKEITSAFGEKVLVDGGGYNCRHKWEIASDEGIKLFEGEQAQQVLSRQTLPATSSVGIFDSIKDAEEFMKSNGVENLNVKSMNIDVVNEMTNALSKIPIKYRNNIVLGDFANFKKITDRKLKGGSHNYGVSISMPKVDTKLLTFAEKKAIFESPISGGDFHIIGINTRKFKTLKKITERKLLIQKQYYERTGRNYFFNTDGKITVHHEFGHILHNQLSSEKRELWDKIAETWAKTANADLLKVKQGWTEHYAEAFSEAWGAYNAGNKTLLPTEVKTFIKEIIND